MGLGLTPNTDLAEQIRQDDFAATRQLFAQQPKGRKLKPLVSEYHQYIAAFIRVNDNTSLQQFFATLPKGAKVCHQKVFPGGVLRGDMQKKYSLTCFAESFGDLTREPMDFVKEAVKKGHPRDILARVTPLARELVDEMVTSSSPQRALRRASFLKRWLRRSLELREEEKKLKHSLPDHIRHILAPKRLLLFKEMLQSLEYRDAAIADDVTKGFALTGWAPKTGVFWLRESKTFDIHTCAIAKRFPLQQSEKVRLMDLWMIFSVCGVKRSCVCIVWTS